MIEREGWSDEENELHQSEADLVANRLEELQEKPIDGNFDVEHLKTIHAYIFQDLPHHQPGITRDDTPDWIKHRVLEGRSQGYNVYYESNDIEGKIFDALEKFGGPESITGRPTDEAAARIAGLYGDLDHAHGFYEGNSRTLREFTRELAKEAGFDLDWTGSGVGTKERNELYLARDLEVLERAFPGLTPEKAMQTNDRAEYETSFLIEGLRRAVGDRPLAAIVQDSLRADYQLERDLAHAPSLEEEVQRADEAARAAARGRQDRIERDDGMQAPKPEAIKESPQPEITRDSADRIEPVELSLDDEVQRAEEAAREAARGRREQIGRDDGTLAKEPQTGRQKENEAEREEQTELERRYGSAAAERIARKFPSGKERSDREQGGRGGRDDDDDGGRER